MIKFELQDHRVFNTRKLGTVKHGGEPTDLKGEVMGPRVLPGSCRLVVDRRCRSHCLTMCRLERVDQP